MKHQTYAFELGVTDGWMACEGRDQIQGFQKKDTRCSKIKNMPDLLSDDKEGKIM